MHMLCALPNSTATVERVFSCINNIKSARLNSLKVKSIRGRLLAKQEVDAFTSYTPSSRLIKDLLKGDISKRYKNRFTDQIASSPDEQDCEDAVEMFGKW